MAPLHDVLSDHRSRAEKEGTRRPYAAFGGAVVPERNLLTRELLSGELTATWPLIMKPMACLDVPHALRRSMHARSVPLQGLLHSSGDRLCSPLNPWTAWPPQALVSLHPCHSLRPRGCHAPSSWLQARLLHCRASQATAQSMEAW